MYYNSGNHRSPVEGYFNPDIIKRFVDRVNVNIDNMFDERTVYIFGHRGSGFALGMALYLSNPERYQLVHSTHLNVRQSPPNHGLMFESGYISPEIRTEEMRNILIVDDYICSGNTIQLLEDLIIHHLNIPYEQMYIAVIAKSDDCEREFDNLLITD